MTIEKVKSKKRSSRERKWRRRHNAAVSAKAVLSRIASAIETDDGSAVGIVNEYMALVDARIDKATKKLRAIEVKAAGTGGMAPLNALVELKRAVT